MKHVLRRVYQLLQKDERRKSMHIVASILVNTFLDFFSLAALLPVLYFLMDGMGNRRAALLFCALAIAVMVLKCIVSTALIKYRNRFLLQLYRRISSTLYNSYFNKGLLFIREHGSNRLTYEVNVYSFGFSQSILAPMATVMGDGLLVVMILGILLWYSPVTALILLISFIPFVLVYLKVIRKKVKDLGKEEQLVKREQYKLVGETYQGYSELMVNNAFSTFNTNFKEGIDKITDYRMRMISVMRFPLLLSELAVVVGITLMILFTEGDIKITLGIFGIAAFRMLPAVRSILAGWTQINNSLHILDTLEEGIQEEEIVNEGEEAPAEEPIRFEHEVKIEDLSYTYPKGEQVFDHFNAEIRKGEQIGFSGYSGVGKSTLFNLLLGFITPDEGRILIDGKPLCRANRAAWLKKIGYVSQEIFLFNGSLADNITVGCPEKEIDRERIMKILSDVSMLDWVETLPEGIDSEMGERGCKLSGGQRQRIGIARALYKEIEVLFLDEATSSLDDETESEIMETLYRLKEIYPSLTILSIAHRKSSLAKCDRIINIKNHGKQNHHE